MWCNLETTEEIEHGGRSTWTARIVTSDGRIVAVAADGVRSVAERAALSAAGGRGFFVMEIEEIKKQLKNN